MDTPYSIGKLNLVTDAISRNKAVVAAGQTVSAGEVILSVPSLVTSLLPKWRGKRCDLCCRNIPTRACSRCKEASYCSANCQTRAWKAHHRRSAEEQANADLLLSLWGLASQTAEDESWDSEEPDMALQDLASDPIHCFKNLVLHPHARALPALPRSLLSSHPKFLNSAWSRFDCNNFVVHNISSLEPESGAYALGIFPLASRCFNHSCSPNAWSAFRLRAGQVWLEVRALENIPSEAEVAIPYLDPVLPFRERQLRLSQIYGFECSCKRCNLEKQLALPTLPPEGSVLLEAAVTEAVFASSEEWEMHRWGAEVLARLPASIRHEEFMKILSTRFESQVHDGPYAEAWLTGRALLALCLLMYPLNYPITGYYAAELAKACWNAYILTSEPIWISRAKGTLQFSRGILEVAGGEEELEAAAGLTTCQTLESLIAAEPLAYPDI